MSYTNGDSSFHWYVGANATTTPNMKLTSTGLSVLGAAISSNRRLKLNEKPLVNALDVIKMLEPT